LIHAGHVVRQRFFHEYVCATVDEGFGCSDVKRRWIADQCGMWFRRQRVGERVHDIHAFVRQVGQRSFLPVLPPNRNLRIRHKRTQVREVPFADAPKPNYNEAR
jgi:hypothetical protein